jgi:peptidoglycan/xylan/chitin deacetylase (PgdA/CDA1 family)
MTNPPYLTISVDDGHPTDLKSAELLKKFGLTATFYIPARNPERELIAKPLIRELAENFELGSHTFNHKPLKDLPDSEARVEIADGKKWLEDLTGGEVVSFCYPRGKFHSGTVKLVREAGFLGARTCMFNLNSFPQNPFLWGVSTHGYSHPIAIQIRHALLEKNFQGIFNFMFTHKLARDWSEHFNHAVDFVDKYGGVAHLYFHSWEIEDRGQWNTLGHVLENISQNKKLNRVTNGDLFRLWYANQ